MVRFKNRRRSQKPVASSRNRFNVAGKLRIVAEGFSNFSDGHAQTVVELDESVFRPEALLQFLTGDNLPVTFHQNFEETAGQVLQFHSLAMARECALAGLKFEWAETIKK